MIHQQKNEPSLKLTQINNKYSMNMFQGEEKTKLLIFYQKFK